MKTLIWKLILPITLITFTLFTKWWYVLPEDAPDSMMLGFPIPYACTGWHTSMSLQIFLLEFLFDLFVYFIFWYLLVWLIRKYITPIKTNPIVTISLISVASLCTLLLLFIAYWPDNIIKLKRSFKFEVHQTGYKFIWEGSKRP